VRFSGKVALVTGAASGIGAATAERLASEGATLVGNDVVADLLEERVERLPGGGHVAIAADVSDPQMVVRMLDEVGERFGHLDVLISNAAVSRTAGDGREESDRAATGPPDRHLGQITYIEDDAWRRMLEINLSSAFYCARAALPLMVGCEGAAIVCVSSIAARAGLGPLHYTSAKAGLLGFIRTLALNVASAGIRVNAVCPGSVETPMARAPGAPPMLTSNIPLGRVAAPDEVAAPICFLASAESSYITGHTLDVNGGMYVN